MKTLLKSIYEKVPFKKELFSALRAVWTPPESLYRHLHFKGVITVHIGKEHSFKAQHYGYKVENDLFWSGIYGGWERNSLDAWTRLSARASVVFDIGANTGIYSLLTKAMNRKAEVHAFEPVSRVYQKLVHNSELNQYNIHCVNKALSNNTGTALLYDNDADHEYSATLSQHGPVPLTHTKEVATITLDDYIEQNGIQRIDLMKIDVEGFEPEVLQGFARYIRVFRPAILIEILEDAVGAQVEALVEGNGYQFYRMIEESKPQRVTALKKFNGFNYLLCDAETAAFLQLT
ncbi:MAG TPA: FkbM family methyltransferase [Chitinophagaceae bacterium]|jgi:FkbM family methyltransferase|nr:FkbM family methyltransferase [Chitinophagaceae bacterium]